MNLVSFHKVLFTTLILVLWVFVNIAFTFYLLGQPLTGEIPFYGLFICLGLLYIEFLVGYFFNKKNNWADKFINWLCG